MGFYSSVICSYIINCLRVDDFVVRSVAIMAVASSCSSLPAQDLELERKYIMTQLFLSGST